MRLVAKDDKLVEQLRFRLIENGETTEERRDECSAFIPEYLDSFAEHSYFSAGRLLSLLRHTSGRITYHVQVTGDKYGEVSLNLEMLLYTLNEYGSTFPYNDSRKLRTLTTYMVKRVQKIIGLIKKLHEDYQLDFMDDLKQLGTLIANTNSLRGKAVELGLDTKSLAQGDFPD